MVNIQEDLCKLFQGNLKKHIEKYIMNNNLQEVRIKINEPCILIADNKEIIIDYIVSREEMKFIIQKISNYSLYACEGEIKQGFITINGGHRVGLAGECVMEGNMVRTIRNISSINIRICKEIIGCSDKIYSYIHEKTRIYNTLIVSPPKCGKTTMLRDIARNISESKKRVTFIDERSEIAACFMGVPQMKLGIRCDVLDNCLKSEGMMMAIRSLSPEVIICDEIGRKEDIEALETAFNSGINIITTIHGFNLKDIKRRNVFDKLINENILERIIILSSRNGPGTLEGVYKVLGKEVLDIV